MWNAYKIIKKFKPAIVIGTGGFASGPTLYMASVKGIKTIIQEQNSYPGITNKLLSKKADKICVAYDGLELFFPSEKIIKTGNPVRQDLLAIAGKREEAQVHFNLKTNKKTLVIVHKSFLMKQWEERILQFLPNARIGKIQGEIIDIENKDIVLGMLQSLSVKEYEWNVTGISA